LIAEVVMDAPKTLSSLACTLALLGILAGTLPAVAQQPVIQATTTTGQSGTKINNGEPLPDSPGAVRSRSLDTKPAEDSIALLEQGQNESSSAAPAQTAPVQRPVGTAAAGASNVNAIAASQPAGVAIAPAKQHRVRTIILKTGAIIAAGVAVGAIVALTAATPSKPPGAH
jgi:hypothetical protein